jgi:hypothetical protein
MSPQVTSIIPLNACRNHAYLYDLAKIPDVLSDEQCTNGIRIAVNLDTEFVEHPPCHAIATAHADNRQGVTVQVSGALDGPEMIFVHPDHAIYAGLTNQPLRHPVMQSECIVVDYLRALGYDVDLHRCDRASYVDALPVCQLDLLAFFAVAELCMVFTGACKQDVKSLVLQHAITQNRRLATRDITRCDDWQLDYCRMPWILTLDGHEYGVRLRWIDVAGLHGVASYRDLLINTGFDVDVKDTIKDLGLITKMHEAYFSHPQEFDEYALGDLKIYPALVRNNANWQHIYETVDLGPYAKSPCLTIGKSIAQLFEGGILQQFDVMYDQESSDDNRSYLSTKDEVLNAVCYYGSAAYFRAKVDSTGVYLAKVFGGRCRTHRVTLPNFAGVLCDLDLSGCYGQGLRAQAYPLGRPFVLQWPIDSHINAYPTLREFLHDRKYHTQRNELMPGLWTACVTLPPGYMLTHPQSFFSSWFDFNARKDTNVVPVDELILDLQEPSLELAVDSGNTKIFHNRIDNAILTQDGLEWILYACSTPQREELLDNLRVISAAYYKQSDHVATVDLLRQRLQEHQGKNTCRDVIRDGVTTMEQLGQECYAWTSVNLGALLVDKLLANRQLYPKKTPLNTLYKLIVNGLFGDMVSPYFAIGNTIVGNNITARARAACWYMEASLNGVQSITDGVQFDVNKVVYPRRSQKQRVMPQAILDLRYERNTHKAKNLTLKPLGSFDEIALGYDAGQKVLYCRTNGQGTTLTTKFVGKDIDTWLNQEAMRHMQTLWPQGISVLHASSTSIKVLNAGSEQNQPIIEYVPRIGQFEFEMKDLYTSAAFHSSANHILVNSDGVELKARSYNKKIEYYAYRLVNGRLVMSERYQTQSPPYVFLEALRTNPHAVPRGDVYVYRKLVKVDEYRQRYNAFFRHNVLDPGDGYVTCGLLKEFSLSQFTMQSPEQWKALEKEYERCKKRYGQYVECFFLNTDETLDYARMIREVQHQIDQGCLSLLKTFDPHDHVTRAHRSREHPAFQTLEAMKAHLETIYGGYVEESPTLHDAFDHIH